MSSNNPSTLNIPTSINNVPTNILHEYVLFHHATFMFVMVVLLFMIMFYGFYLKLQHDLKNTKCYTMNNTKNVDEQIHYLYVMSIIGLTITGFCVTFIGLHYFYPFISF